MEVLHAHSALGPERRKSLRRLQHRRSLLDRRAAAPPWCPIES